MMLIWCPRTGKCSHDRETSRSHGKVSHGSELAICASEQGASLTEVLFKRLFRVRYICTQLSTCCMKHSNKPIWLLNCTLSTFWGMTLAMYLSTKQKEPLYFSRDPSFFLLLNHWSMMTASLTVLEMKYQNGILWLLFVLIVQILCILRRMAPWYCQWIQWIKCSWLVSQPHTWSFSATIWVHNFGSVINTTMPLRWLDLHWVWQTDLSLLV